MKFLRYVAGYALKDQTRNDSIRQQLGIFNLNDRIQQNKKELARTHFTHGPKNYPINFTI
jgi:hypothetical protein